jgi:hypothetical protein
MPRSARLGGARLTRRQPTPTQTMARPARRDTCVTHVRRRFLGARRWSQCETRADELRVDRPPMRRTTRAHVRRPSVGLQRWCWKASVPALASARSRGRSAPRSVRRARRRTGSRSGRGRRPATAGSARSALLRTGGTVAARGQCPPHGCRDTARRRTYARDDRARAPRCAGRERAVVRLRPQRQDLPRELALGAVGEYVTHLLAAAPRLRAALAS